MKKTRILAFLLSLCMLTALLPTTVLAATDTYDVPASTLVYELSGTSSNDHTTANYAWTNGGMLYLALTTREDKPVLTSNVIIAGVPYSLTVPSDRYDFLAIDNVSYGAIGKLSNQTYKWQIVSCSYGQSLALNQTLTLSTTAQGGGFELHGAAYTVSGTVQETYAVTYTYAFDPTAPDNAPSAPTDPNLYMENSSVTLATEPSVEGYTFTGWSSTDVTLPLPGGTFTMPSSNVTITGSFVKNAIPIKFYILDPTIVVPVDGKNMGSGSYYPVANWQASSQTYIYETNLPGTLSNAILTQLAGSDGKLTVGDKLLVEDIDSSLLSGIEYPSDVSAALTRFGLSGSGYTPVAYVIKAQNPNNYVGSVGDDWFGYDDNNNPCDIHVDCYLSPVPVSVTYHSNFNPDSTYQTAVMNTGTVYTVLGYNDTNLPLNGQSSFLGWATSSTGDVVFTANNTFTVMGNSHLYAKWGTTPPVTTPVTYAIHYYFEDAVGTVKQSATVDSGSAPAVSNASVSYKPASVLLSYDSTKTYVLDTTKTSSSFVWTTDGQVFDVYYAVDMVGTPGTPTGPDSIPDMYQFPVNFKVVNGIWNDTSSADKVVYLTKLLNGVWNVNGTATLTSGQIPTGMTPNTGYLPSGSWDTTPNTTTPLSQATTYTFTFQQEPPPVQKTYAIHYYFEDAVGNVTQSATVDSGSAPAVSNASVSYKPASVLLSYDSTKTYVLDTTKTSSSFVWTTDGQVFDVYYAVDMVGTPGTPTGPDGIPDMYQFPVNFKVVNGIWSDTSSADKVVYLTKLLNGVWNVNGTATLTSGQIPTGMTPNTGYILPGSWDTTPNTTTPLSQAATYTFTFTVDTRVFNITYTLNSVTNPPYTPALSTLNETGVLHGTNKNVKGNLTTTSVTNGIVIGTWTFSGWTPTTPSNITVANGAFTMPTNDVEFTGSWSFTKAGEFTVVYSDGSGNTYAGGTYDTGIPYTVLGNGTTNFTKDGHFFAGWSNNAGKTNAVGATDTSSSSTTITYTAVWRADDFGYTVNYYKDSVSSDNLLGSESGTGTFGANIPYTDGNYLPAGYVIPGTLGGQTTITSTAANNVLNVVYAKNSAVGYTVRYYTRPSTNGPWTEIGSITSTGTFGAAIPYNLYLYFPSSGYDSNVYFSGALTISADASANIVNIVYTKLPDPIDPTNPTNPTNPTSPTSPTNPTINDDEVDIEDNETPLAGLLGLLNTEDHFNYVIGYEDGTVHPNGNLTRAEATTIFFRLLTEEARAIYLTEENEFSDVNEGQWFNAAISTLASIGIVTGYEDGTFRPNAMITRAELAAIIARFAELEGSAQFVFTDINGHWAEASILLAASNGWITGYENGTFRPNLAITRAETVTMINRVLDRLPKNKEALLEEMLTFSDNLDTEEWYYIPIQEATNYHKYAKNEAGETWTELIENIDWTIYEQ